jgi:glycerol dehydrogenase
VILIAGGTAQRVLQPIWKSVLPAEGIEPLVFPFGGECSREEVARLVRQAEGSAAVAVVGAGGGKASDTARAVADELDLPAILTPTLASTDSPCSALSVLYGAGGNVEGFRFYNRHPLLVLVDTTVVARAPKRYLVGGLGDALATWFEARTVRESGDRTMVGGLPSTTSTALAKLCCDLLLADRATLPGESSHNEPFPVTAEAVISALKAADQLGRQRR